ncbi:MAG: hypothetical protein GEU79_17815 [Acidimicrobiia bacterium]|nr:hypothetical protein [Acidimicrobiia bacterium]
MNPEINKKPSTIRGEAHAFGISLVGYISSLRETGVVFAALFGWWFFKDPYGRLRILGTIAVVAGVVTLSVGGAA